MWNESLEGLIVVKRSGQRVEFNASKIAIAIKKAFEAVYKEVDEKDVFKVFESVLTFLNNTYKERKTINVEDIQDVIETSLKENKFESVYNAFHDYRLKRAASRKVFDEKHQHKFVKAVEIVQEQAYKEGVNLTPSDILYKFGQIISSEYTKSYILDSKYVRALEEGSLYIHDLDYFPLGYLSHLNLKLSIKEDDKYLDEFISEVINARREVSDEIGINSLDLILESHILNIFKRVLKDYLKKYLHLSGFLEFVPIRKYEEAIDRINDTNEINNAISTLIVNTNLKNIIVNAIKDSKDSIEIYIKDMINKIFNMLRINQKPRSFITISISSKASEICNLVKDEIFLYLTDNNYLENIHTIFKIDDVSNTEYLSKIASQIINKKNISVLFNPNSTEYFRNGMRLSMDGSNPATGRMIVASTSINLARLGLKSKGNMMVFYEKLEQMLELAKNELLVSFETIGNKNKENYDILFKGNILGDERLEQNQKIRKIIKAGTLNIGLIGLKECLTTLEPNETKQYDFLTKILDFLTEKCQKYSDETKLNFSLFEPSGTESRKSLIKIDKSIYGCDKDNKNKQMYDLLDTAKFIKSYKELGTLQKYFKGGMHTRIKLSSKVSNKYIIDLLKELSSTEIERVQIEVGSS